MFKYSFLQWYKVTIYVKILRVNLRPSPLLNSSPSIHVLTLITDELYFAVE